MGTTSTTNLLLVKPNPGEEENTWGPILNANWDKVDAIGTASVKAVAAQTPAADKFAYYTSTSAAALATVTSFARTILDDADAATVRGTLGLGSIATLGTIDLTANVTNQLPIANGGTGASSAETARSNLAVAGTGVSNTFTNTQYISSGDLVVGTTGGLLATGRVRLSDATKGFEAEITTTGSSGAGLYVNRTSSDGWFAGFYRGGTSVGNIAASGGATYYNTASDYRLKENVVPLSGATARLTTIPVHRFNFVSAPDKTLDGFIAHEVQKVVPEAVTGAKDAVELIEIKDESGNIIRKEEHPAYQMIDQTKLIPLLMAALQETISDLQALRNRVDALTEGR